jgi:hypothetical protein
LSEKITVTVTPDQVKSAEYESVLLIPSPGLGKRIVIDDYDGLGTITYHIEDAPRTERQP